MSHAGFFLHWFTHNIYYVIYLHTNTHARKHARARAHTWSVTSCISDITYEIVWNIWSNLHVVSDAYLIDIHIICIYNAYHMCVWCLMLSHVFFKCRQTFRIDNLEFWWCSFPGAPLNNNNEKEVRDLYKSSIALCFLCRAKCSVGNFDFPMLGEYKKKVFEEDISLTFFSHARNAICQP